MHTKVIEIDMQGVKHTKTFVYSSEEICDNAIMEMCRNGGITKFDIKENYSGTKESSTSGKKT